MARGNNHTYMHIQKNILERVKRGITVATTVAVIFWSMGISLIIPPFIQVAHAVAPSVVSAMATPDPTTGTNKEVMIRFSEAVKTPTVECASSSACASIYTVSGPITVNQAVREMSGNATSTPGVILKLAAVATNGTTTVTIANTVQNVGNEALSGAGSPITLQQKFPPMIKGVRLKSGSTTTVVVVFDQEMKSTTTNVTARYTVQTTATDTETISSATLQAGNKTVDVVASGATIANGDKLNISGMSNFQSLGGDPAQGNEFFTVDGVAPTVTGVVITNNTTGNDFAYVKFDDRMNSVTATTVSNYTPNAGSITAASLEFYNPSTSPSWMTSSMSEKVVKLTTPDVTLITSTITVSTNVTDVAGNAMNASARTATLSGGSSSAIKIDDLGVSAVMTKGSWKTNLDGCNDSFGDTGNSSTSGCASNTNDANRDTIAIPFNGQIDTAAMGEASGVIKNVSTYLEIYDKWTYSGTSQASCFGSDVFNGTQCVGKTFANLADSYAKVTNGGHNAADKDLLTIYLQGFVSVWNGMEINPFNVRGMNALPAGQNTTAAKNKIPMPVFAEVDFVKADKTLGVSNTAFDDSDTVTLFFSADMQRTDIGSTADISGVNAKIKPRQMMPWAEHTWGTGGALAISWGNRTGADLSTCTAGGSASDSVKDCLKITLGGSTTVKEGDEMMVSGLSSAAGTPLGFGGKIDTIAPTVAATMNTTTNVVTITFSEEMVEVDGDGIYSNNITYTGTGGATNAAIDTTKNTDGFTAGIKLVNESMAGGGGTATGSTGGWMPIKKFMIKLNATPETGDSIGFTNFKDEGGAAIPSTLSLAGAVDAVAPTICKVIQNDWDNNGSLNAWDEVILVFDNQSPADSTNGCVSDVDYSTITDPNTDFIVKRAGVAVPNAFGQGAHFWIDQWDIHAGEFHINLGQSASIQAGDTIWATSGEVKDASGNAMNHLVAQITLASVQAGEISRIEFTDNGAVGLTHSDVFKVVFNEAIDTTTVGTLSGSTVSNLDWGLQLQYNFDQKAGTGAVYTYEMKTWGQSTNGTWNAGNTELTITIDCNDVGSATACDDPSEAKFGDGDRVETWPVRTAAGGSVKKPGTIDFSKPVLSKVAGMKTLGADPANWDAGDQLIFVFSEPMKASSFTTGTIATLATELDLDTGTAANFGTTGAAAVFMDPSVLVVTLGAGHNIDNNSKFNPASTIKDINGNADNTVAGGVGIILMTIPAPTNPALADSDTTNPGINGMDMRVTWTSATGAAKYFIYLLPEVVMFNPANHNPVAIASASSACPTSSCSFTGNTGITSDSRSTTAAGAIDSTKPFFPLNEFDKYVVYVMASNDALTEVSFPSISPAVKFTLEYGNDGTAPKVENTMPWNGAKDILLNQKTMTVKFSEAMKRSGIETGSGILFQKKTGTTWNSVAATVSYNEADFSATIKPTANLEANADYRIQVTTSAVDAGGVGMGKNYETYFSTAGTSDTTAPKVKTYFIDGATSTTSIARNSSSVAVEFTDDIDGTTLTSTSVTLSPSVGGSSIKYDPFFRSLIYSFGGPLEKTKTYTLTLSGVYIKDIAGNTLDGDGNGTALGTTGDNYTLSFVTVSTDLTTTKPVIKWIDSDGKRINIGFSDKMEKGSIETKANWTLKQGTTAVNLQTATFFFDNFVNELRIDGVDLPPDTDYTLVPNASVLGMNGQPLDTTTTPGSLNFRTFNKNTFFNAATIKTMDQGATGFTGTFNGDIFGKMANADTAAMDKNVKMFMPISVWPTNQTENKTSNYHVNFPTTKAIPSAGQIVLQFPASFDVSSAAIATESGGDLFFFNKDINGPEGTSKPDGTFNSSGKVQITAVSGNNQTKKVTLTVSVDDGTGCTLTSAGVFEAACTNGNTGTTRAKTMPLGFLDFEIKGIKNGSAAAIDWFNNTGGYEIEITTKDNDGKTLEGPIKSMKFDIKQAGSGSISGAVTTSDGTTAIANAVVFLDSPLAGHQETTTDATGNYSFTQLPVAQSANAWDGWYNVWVQSPKESADYFGGQSFNIQLTSGASTSSGNNAKLNTGTNVVTFTVNYDSAMEGKKLQLWASGPFGWKEKKITLADTDGNSGNGYSDTNETMKVATGTWDFGIMPYMEQAFFGAGSNMEQDFMPPKPEQKNVTGATAITFTLSTASLTISGKVTDGTSSLSNVEIFAYAPSGQGFGSNAKSGSDGTYKLKVTAGTYNVGAFKSGLPSIPDRVVTVSANVTGIDFVFVKAGSSISGNVSDGTNAIQWAGVNAWTTDGKFAWSSTDEQGEYTMFLEPGAWNVNVFAPGYGQITAATGVTPTNIVVALNQSVTGINFSVGSGTFNTISGRVKDSSGNGVANIFVTAEETGFSGGTAGAFNGKHNDAKTDASGNYTLKVPASVAGTGGSATRYTLHAWGPEYGEIKPDSSTTVDISAGSSTGNDFTLAAKRTVTISIIDGDQIENDAGLNPADIAKGFLEISSLTNDTGNEKNLKNIELTNGDNATSGTLTVPQAGGYTATLDIPGVGVFTGTVGGAETFSITSDTTVVFDLNLDGAGSVITLSGTTTDGTTALANAWVNVTNQSTFKTYGTASGADGTYSFKMPAGTYALRADKPGYKGAPEVTVSANDALRTLALTLSGSSIKGELVDASGTDTTPYAFVWAEEVSGTGWVGVEADKDGKYTLPVPAGTTWKVYAQDEQGNVGAITTGTAAGATGKDFTLNTTLAGSGLISAQAKVEPVTPSQGKVIDDTINTGVKLTLSENALGTGTSSAQVVVKETAAVPNTTQVAAFGGVGKEITATDSSGAPITNLQTDAVLELVYTKSEVETFAVAADALTQNGLEELDNLQNSYWDATTQTLVALSTTETVQVKDYALDTTWEGVPFATFFANVTAETANPSNTGASNKGKDYYYDYKLSLTSTTDHFTLFTPTVPTDSSAPAVPTGLSATAISGSVTLDWANNSEGDIMEYEVYRGTSSALTCNNSSQLNTSAVIASAYTDSTVGTNSYTYYYKVSAADTSGNESACTSTAVAATYTKPAATGGGSSGGSYSSVTQTDKDKSKVSEPPVSDVKPPSQKGAMGAPPLVKKEVKKELKMVSIESPKAGTLNVRKGAGSKNAKVAAIKHGAKYSILEEKKVGKEVWYKVEYAKGKTGWISAQFTKAEKAPKPAPKKTKADGKTAKK